MDKNEIALKILCAIMPSDKTELLMDKPKDRVGIAFIYAEEFLKHIEGK